MKLCHCAGSEHPFVRRRGVLAVGTMWKYVDNDNAIMLFKRDILICVHK